MKRDSASRLMRLGYSGPYPFTIDGKEMPMPSKWDIEYLPLMSTAERSVSTSELQAVLQGIFPTVIWEYALLTSDQYNMIFDAYVKATAINMSPWHTITTLDNNNNLFTMETYYQNDFKPHRAFIRNGISYYKNVTLTFVAKKRWEL